eukprot:g2153.t1
MKVDHLTVDSVKYVVDYHVPTGVKERLVTNYCWDTNKKGSDHKCSTADLCKESSKWGNNPVKDSSLKCTAASTGGKVCTFTKIFSLNHGSGPGRGSEYTKIADFDGLVFWSSVIKGRGLFKATRLTTRKHGRRILTTTKDLTNGAWTSNFKAKHTSTKSQKKDEDESSLPTTSSTSTSTVPIALGVGVAVLVGAVAAVAIYRRRQEAKGQQGADMELSVALAKDESEL